MSRQCYRSTALQIYSATGATVLQVLQCYRCYSAYCSEIGRTMLVNNLLHFALTVLGLQKFSTFWGHFNHNAYSFGYIYSMLLVI